MTIEKFDTFVLKDEYNTSLSDFVHYPLHNDHIKPCNPFWFTISNLLSLQCRSFAGKFACELCTFSLLNKKIFFQIKIIILFISLNSLSFNIYDLKKFLVIPIKKNVLFYFSHRKQEKKIHMQKKFIYVHKKEKKEKLYNL